MYDGLFLFIARTFNVEAYLDVSKVQSLLWSIGDVTILWFGLLIAKLSRPKNKQASIIIRFIILGITIVMVACLMLMNRLSQWNALEVSIVGIHFLLVFEKDVE